MKHLLQTMPIGLICAIPQELDELRYHLTTAFSDVRGQVQFETGTLDGHNVVLAGSGMGKVNASIVATVMADRFACRTIVFSGVAGGLDPALSIGDVVIADRVIQHDAGLIDSDGLRTYQAGHVPFINPTQRLGYAVDPDLLARVKHRLNGFGLPALSSAAGGDDRPAQIAYGTVLSGDQYLHDDSTRTRLHGQFSGRAIEMEGGAVAQACESFMLPWLVIRTLSDLAGHDSGLEFTTFVDEVAATSADILRRILPTL
jgi:adenosylhomocysteine nucleosidase